MLNVLDLDDVVLNSKAKLDGYAKDFQKEYFAPLIDTQIAEMWQKIPDEIKMMLRQENKKAVDKLEKKLGGM